jgi:hypothetical protein
MLQNPLLRAAATGHTGLLQIGAGGAVQKPDTGRDLFMKLFFGQHGVTAFYNNI